jgi:alkylation response protein AidB-like acyl-CoA dehydrogenase
MELEFTPDQDELRDSIRTVLAKESPIARARAVAEGTGDVDKLWSVMTELGWPALTVPESCDGIGLGPVEAGILAEELGRVVAPGPLLPTVTQFVPLLRLTTGQDDVLRDVAAGACRGSLAIAERTGSWDEATIAATASHQGGDHVLSGRKHFVFDGDQVDKLLVIVRHDDEPLAAVVDTADVETNAIRSLDATRRLVEVSLDGVRVPAERTLAPDIETLQRALAEATVSLALEMVGACQSIFDITLEYAKQREQFGVPIGSFQAVKHKLADMAVALERARATAYFATLTLAENDSRWPTAVSVAKVAAGDCQRLLAKEGIQLHGGIGYTWEHDMHLYVKRAKTSEALFGTSTWHRTRIASELLAAG